jgi:hypothetical protein
MASSRLANSSGAICSGAGSVVSAYTHPSRTETGYVRMFSPPNMHLPSVSVGRATLYRALPVRPRTVLSGGTSAGSDATPGD